MAWAELTDSRCWYDTTGQGDPLVLIPGLGSTSHAWDPVVGPLSEWFTVIRMDNRGIGESIARRPAMTLRDYAADVTELLGFLHLEHAHVLGLSLGGMIAQRVAMDHGPRVDRLVLVSTAHRFGPYLKETAMLVARALRHFPRAQYTRFFEILGSSPGFLDRDPAGMERRVAEAIARHIPRHVIAHQLRVLAASDPRPGDFAIGSPTFVVAGEFDAIIPNCYGRQMAEAIGPHASFHLVESAGHNPFLECPERIIPRIIEFLTCQGGSAATAG